MIICDVFEGDNNETMKLIQHDTYSKLLGYLFSNSASRYLDDIKYTWVSPDFVSKIRNLKSFDHRTLQYAHDLIAAYFRFIFSDSFPSDLFPEKFDIISFFTSIWKEYYLQEVAILSKIEPIAEMIVTAVGFQNTERGYDAEDKLHELLLQRYQSMPMLRNISDKPMSGA